MLPKHLQIWIICALLITIALNCDCNQKCSDRKKQHIESKNILKNHLSSLNGQSQKNTVNLLLNTKQKPVRHIYSQGIIVLPIESSLQTSSIYENGGRKYQKESVLVSKQQYVTKNLRDGHEYMNSDPKSPLQKSVIDSGSSKLNRISNGIKTQTKLDYQQASSKPSSKSSINLQNNNNKVNNISNEKVLKPQIGGYINKNVQKSTHGLQAITFANDYFQNRLEGAIITSFFEQVVSGINYKFLLKLKNGLQYQIIVYRSLSGKYEITYYSLYNTPVYGQTKLQKCQNTIYSSNVRKIDDVLKKDFVKQLGNLGRVVQSYVQQPYYMLVYLNTNNISQKIIVVYDSVSQKIKIITNQIIKSNKTDISNQKVKEISNKTIIKQKPEPNTNSTAKENITNNTSTKVSLPASTNTTSNPNLQPNISLNRSPFLLYSCFEYPVFTNTTNRVLPANNSLNLIPTPSDISILYDYYGQQMDSVKLQAILNKIVSEVKIYQQISIILVSQIRYAVRLVIQFNSIYTPNDIKNANDFNTNRLFQAVVSYVNTSNPNVKELQIQLISWREISSIVDIDHRVFTKYYEQQTSGVYLNRIISNISTPANYNYSLSFFNTDTKNVTKILKIQKKPTYDGIYYKLLLELSDNNQYEVIVYWMPEVDYLQIQKYQRKYAASLGFQNIVQTIDQNEQCDHFCRQIMKSLFQKYVSSPGIQYNSAQFTLRKMINFNNKSYLRFKIDRQASHYQFLVSKLNSYNYTLERFQKDNDGYRIHRRGFVIYPQTQQTYQTQQIIAVARQFYTAKMNNIQFYPIYVEQKYVSGLGKFYKLIFQSPIPYKMIIQYNNTSGKKGSVAKIRGVHKIPIQPRSVVYNDIELSGYTQINITNINVYVIYKNLQQLLYKSRSQINKNNSKLIALFQKFHFNGVTKFQAYYTVNSSNGVNTYTANFEYFYRQKNYQLIQFKKWSNMKLQGSYYYRCQPGQIYENQGTCAVCQHNLMIAQRCYDILNNCTIAIGGSCLQCNQVFRVVDDTCVLNIDSVQSNSTKMDTFPQFSPIFTQEITSAKQLLTKRYKMSQYVDCIKFSNSVCSECKERFYPDRGICEKISDACVTYDARTGNCLTCISGYHLNQGIVLSTTGNIRKRNCIKNDTNCQKYDNGFCTKCSQYFESINGQCRMKK